MKTTQHKDDCYPQRREPNKQNRKKVFNGINYPKNFPEIKELNLHWRIHWVLNSWQWMTETESFLGCKNNTSGFRPKKLPIK